MKGGAPRAVWLPVYADPLVLPARAVAERLIELAGPVIWSGTRCPARWPS
jgi:hypothetical protein